VILECTELEAPTPMFTAGRRYTTTQVAKTMVEVTDDLGHSRIITLDPTPRFYIYRDEDPITPHATGPIRLAHFRIVSE
jgi:hypothetical protein